MNYNYRKLTISDINYLYELFGVEEYHKIFFEKKTTKDDWMKRYEHIKEFEVVCYNNTKIGVINIVKGKVIDLLLIVINLELLGKGIGSNIFSDIFEMYGSNIYHVTVKETNVRACNFYTKLGFEIYDTEEQDLGENGKHKYLNLAYKMK